MKHKILLLLCLLFSAYSYAIKVEGTVLDENKDPIIGASVRIKGNEKVGTITDFDGKFILKVPNVKKAILIVSYVGFKTKRVPLRGRSILTIEMEPDIETLDEVIVVGYGSVRKSDLTGAVSIVKTTEDEAARTSSFNKLLQGKAAGVSVSTGSAAPGGSISVRIRGASSLRGNNSPLYVIDGNIVSDLGDTMNPMAEGSGSGNSRAEMQNPLAFISSQDIASVEILKDASATAIYGSQGANGVVLITTKRGKTGKPSIILSSNLSFSTMAKQIPVLNSEEYIQYHNADAFSASSTKPITMDALMPVNWQDKSTRLAVSQNYRATVSGKSKKTDYYFAVGFADQQGIIRKTGVTKYDFRLNLNQELNDYIDLKTNTSYGHIQTKMTSGTDKLANTRTSLIRHMISYKPLIGLEEEYDDYDEEVTTPESWFTDYDDDSEESTFNTNLVLNVKPLKWLTFRLKGGLIHRQKERSMWLGRKTYLGSKTNGKAGNAVISATSYNAEALFLFKKSFQKKHNLSGTLGVVYNKKKLKQTSLTAENFFSEELRADGISTAALQYPYKYKKVGTQLFSALMRGVYSYCDRYVVTATFRADGSSKFSSSNRFSYFPSFALAWRINQEAFMKKYETISNLKLRLGWGQVGNQAIDAYQTLGSYNTNSASSIDGGLVPGIIPARIANPNLKWETSQQYNVGLDVGLFDQRLSFTFDAFIKNTKNLLQEIAIPLASGYSSMWINNGRIENKGIEFSFSANPIRQKKIDLSIGGNISFIKNTIKKLGMSSADFGMLHNQKGYWGATVGNNTFTKFPANVFLVNHSIGLFMGYQTNGIMQETEYNSSANQNQPLIMKGTKMLPGDIRYVDQNGDRIIDDNDRVILGNPNPDFTYAFNSTLNYKKWTLDLSCVGVVGGDIINANLIDETDVKNNHLNVRRDAYYEAWTPQNKSNTYPRLGYEPKGVLSDRLVESGSYFKLSHISLSYLFNFKKSKAIRSLSLTATASNIFTITSYSGFDPDVNTFANDTDRLGIDLTSYPSARNFTLGVVAKF